MSSVNSCRHVFFFFLPFFFAFHLVLINIFTLYTYIAFDISTLCVLDQKLSNYPPTRFEKECLSLVCIFFLFLNRKSNRRNDFDDVIVFMWWTLYGRLGSLFVIDQPSRRKKNARQHSFFETCCSLSQRILFLALRKVKDITALSSQSIAHFNLSIFIENSRRLDNLHMSVQLCCIITDTVAVGHFKLCAYEKIFSSSDSQTDG
jgi:hypothetical protein